MASPGKKAYPLRIDPALWVAIERLAAQGWQPLPLSVRDARRAAGPLRDRVYRTVRAFILSGGFSTGDRIVDGE